MKFPDVKMKTKISQCRNSSKNPNRKIVERDKIDTPNTQRHDYSETKYYTSSADRLPYCSH